MPENAGTVYSEIRIMLDKLTGDVKQTQALYDKLGVSIGTTSTQTEKKVNTSLQNINLAHIALFAAIAAYVKKSVTDYASFEQSLANVNSVAKASAADMALLEKAASDAGQATKFTGTQAANALYYLASAGMSARQSVDALDGVLALASATQSDLAFTSEAVASALSQFGLQASDSLRVANVFAAGIAASQATMDKLATSMRYVGPVAAAFGYSIEEVTGTLSILYNAGFEASQAGTALRGMLADLSNAASPAIDKLKALGISFESVNPAANSLSEVIAALNPIAENGGKIMEVFGDRAGPAMIKLLQAGAGEIEKYTARVSGTNQAVDAAAIQNDTLQFALAQLNKGFGSVGKGIVEEFAPGMKNAANGIANLLFKISAMPAPLKILFGVLAGGVVVFTGLTGAISLFGISVAAIAGPIAIVISAFAALTAGSILLYRAYNQAANNTINLQKTQTNLETNTNALKQSVDNYKKANEELNDKTKTLNDTEKRTLEQRKALSGLEVAANLSKTVKSLEDMRKEQEKQSDSITGYDKKIKELNTTLDRLRNMEIALNKEKQAGEKYTSVQGASAATVASSLETVSAAIKTNEEVLRKNTTGVLNSKLANDNANKSRQETIDYLAMALSLGQIEYKQIETYNLFIALEVLSRQRQMETVKTQTAVQGKLNGVKGISIELTSEEIDANKELQKVIQKAKQDLDDLNASELQKIENDRKRAKAEVDLMEVSATAKEEGKAALDVLYDAQKKKVEIEIEDEKQLEALNNQIEAHNEKLKISEEQTTKVKNALIEYIKKKKEQQEIEDKQLATAQKYVDKLAELTDRNYDVLEAERVKEEAAIRAAGGSNDAINKSIEKLNEYYDALKNKTAIEEFMQNMKEITTTVVNGFNDLISTLSDIADIQAQQQIDAIDLAAQAQMDAIDDQIEAEYGKNDELLTAQQELLDEQLQAALEAAGVAEETQMQRLERELAAAIAENDMEKAAELQKEITRLQITQGFAAKQKALEDQAIIDKKSAEDAKILIEDEAAKRTADIKYKADHAGWIADGWLLAGKALLAEMQAWTSPFWAVEVPLVTLGVGALITQHALTEPQPPTFQSGGIVLGSEGGTIVRAAENNTNELLLNDSPAGKAMLYEMADAIISRMQSTNNGVPAIINLVIDGNIVAQSTVNIINNGKYQIESRGLA